MTFLVRTAKPNDLPAIQSIHVEAFGCIGESADSIQLPQTDEGILFVVENFELEVIGYSTLSGQGQTFRCDWLAVASASRVSGAGTALLQTAIQTVHARNGKTISLETRNRFRSAIRLYLKHGFDIVGTYTGMDGDLMIKLQKRFE